MSDPTFKPSSDLDAPKEKMAAGEKSTLGCLALVLAPFAFIIVMIIIGAVVGSGANNEPNGFEAIRYCEDAVRDDLVAPTTAEFDSQASETNPFRVWGTVDAQNSFGAMVRNDFSCTVNITDDSFTATVDYLG